MCNNVRVGSPDLESGSNHTSPYCSRSIGLSVRVTAIALAVVGAVSSISTQTIRFSEYPLVSYDSRNCSSVFFDSVEKAELLPQITALADSQGVQLYEDAQQYFDTLAADIQRLEDHRWPFQDGCGNPRSLLNRLTMFLDRGCYRADEIDFLFRDTKVPVASASETAGCPAIEDLAIAWTVRRPISQLGLPQHQGTALILRAVADHNGALSLSSGSGGIVRHLDEAYRIRYRRVGSNADICREIQEAPEPPELLLLDMHGSRWSLTLSQQNKLTGFNYHELDGCLDRLPPYARVVLLSCSAAEGGIFADHIASRIAGLVPGRWVIAPTTSVTSMDMKIDQLNPLTIRFIRNGTDVTVATRSPIS